MESNTWTYVGIYSLLALEGTIVLGVFFPGVTVLVTAGFFAGTGDLRPELAAIAAGLGLLTGDLLTYTFSRFAIRRFRRIHSYVDARRERIVQGMSMRNPAIYFFQFPMPTRVLVPAVAGLSKFPVARWLGINVISSALFVSVVGGAGFWCGRVAGELGLAVQLGKYIQFVFIGLLIVFVAYQAIGLWRRRHSAEERSRDEVTGS